MKDLMHSTPRNWGTITLSKRAERRLAHTHIGVRRSGFSDKVRTVHFDVGRFLDRSKYTP